MTGVALQAKMCSWMYIFYCRIWVRYCRCASAGSDQYGCRRYRGEPGCNNHTHRLAEWRTCGVCRALPRTVCDADGNAPHLGQILWITTRSALPRLAAPACSALISFKQERAGQSGAVYPPQAERVQVVRRSHRSGDLDGVDRRCRAKWLRQVESA